MRDKITAFAALTFFAVLIVALHAAYVSLDEQGYVPHESELLISADSSWLQSEAKTCISVPIGWWWQTERQQSYWKHLVSASEEERDRLVQTMNPRETEFAYIVAINYSQRYSSSKLSTSGQDFMRCDGGPKHLIKIKFFGNIHSSKTDAKAWRCTRESSSFTCKELATGVSTVSKRDVLELLNQESSSMLQP